MPLAMFNEPSHIGIRRVSESNHIDHCPPGIYNIRLNPDTGEIMLFKDRVNFPVPDKKYGKHEQHKRAILDDWAQTQGTLGVLLQGLKGSGKSMLAEDLANNLLAQDVPVFLIDRPISPVVLLEVCRVASPCMVYFDEFGKVYDAEQRAGMLTFFSDSNLKRVMNVVTGNDDDEVSSFMIDRPGRFKYRIKYHPVEHATIVELFEGHKLSDEMTRMVAAYCKYYSLSFDILRYLVPLVKASKTIEEFNERISILNVPDPIYLTWSADWVYLDGESFYGEVELVKKDEFHLRCFKPGVIEPVINEFFDLDSVQVESTKDDLTCHRLNVKISDRITLRLNSDWSNTQKPKQVRHFVDPDTVPDVSPVGRGKIQQSGYAGQQPRGYGLIRSESTVDNDSFAEGIYPTKRLY